MPLCTGRDEGTFLPHEDRRAGGACAAVVIICVALVAAVASAACDSAPAQVPLQVLADQQEEYDGRVVSTDGVVVPIEDRPGSEAYFVLEDEANNRIRLHPDSVAREHLHESVVVTGEFRFNPEAGRELHIDSITTSG